MNPSNGTSTHENNSVKYIHNCRSYGPDKVGRTPVHRTVVVTTISRLKQAGSTNMGCNRHEELLREKQPVYMLAD